MKNNNYQLNINYHNVEYAFQLLQNTFKTRYGVLLTQNDNEVVSRASSQIKDKEAWLGTKGIANKKITKLLDNPKNVKVITNISLNTRISDMAFVLFVTSGFHELQHFRQEENELQGKTYLIDEHLSEIDVLMGIQCLANSGNRFYYESNYKYNISEVNAEMHGFVDAFVFLKHLFPDKEEILKKVFVDVYNYKASAYGYWLHEEYQKKRFETIEDIEHAFIATIHKLCDKDYVALHSVYPAVYSDILMNDNNPCINEALTRVETFSNTNKEWNKIYCSIIGSRGYQADKKLAAIVHYFHPEWKQTHAILDNIDLDMNTIFGIDPPDMQLTNKTTETNIHETYEEVIPETSNLNLWIHDARQIIALNRENHVNNLSARGNDDGQPSL